MNARARLAPACTKRAESRLSQAIRTVEQGDASGADKRQRIRELLAAKDRVARPLARGE